MNTFRIVAMALLAAAPAHAGSVDQSAFTNAPVLGETGLVALAVVTGLAGIRLVRKYHNTQVSRR